jgi:hypothetical protein
MKRGSLACLIPVTLVAASCLLFAVLIVRHSAKTTATASEYHCHGAYIHSRLLLYYTQHGTYPEDLRAVLSCDDRGVLSEKVLAAFQYYATHDVYVLNYETPRSMDFLRVVKGRETMIPRLPDSASAVSRR